MSTTFFQRRASGSEQSPRQSPANEAIVFQPTTVTTNGGSGFEDFEHRRAPEHERIAAEILNSPLGKEVLDIIAKRSPPHFYFHNPQHTEETVYAVCRIAAEEGLSAREIAAAGHLGLLHDLGNTVERKGHEQHSVTMARELLKKYGVNDGFLLAELDKAILSTAVDFDPKRQTVVQKALSRMGGILGDADVENFGKDYFLDRAFKFFKETNPTSPVKTMEELAATDAGRDYLKFMVRMLEAHSWNTESARARLDSGKTANLRLLKNILLEHGDYAVDKTFLPESAVEFDKRLLRVFNEMHGTEAKYLDELAGTREGRQFLRAAQRALDIELPRGELSQRLNQLRIDQLLLPPVV